MSLRTDFLMLQQAAIALRLVELAIACVSVTAVALAQSNGIPGTSKDGSLTEIGAVNIGALTPVYSLHLAESGGGYIATPIAGSNTLFVLTAFPHKLYAIDLGVADGSRGPSVKWSYTPDPNRMASGVAPAGVVVGGPVVSDERVYFNTQDGQVIALNAGSGDVAWKTQLADVGIGETLAAAPLVAKDRIIVGNAGAEFGVRGWIAALDRETGQQVWRVYNTGPDNQVAIGTSFKPFYATDHGGDLGTRTWPPAGWEHGGGTLAGPIAYDPATGLVYNGTGPPAPTNPDQRPGANKWTSGLFARDASSGSARWFDQINPRDAYGFGAAGSNIVLDRTWRGASRPLLIHPDGNGYVYVIDRGTGEMLAADRVGYVNATSGVDLATGAPRPNRAKSISTGKTTRDICPGWPGSVAPGADAAFSNDTGLLYIPATVLCMDEEARDANYIRGTAYSGATFRAKAAPGEPRGKLIAWDIENGRPVWTIPEAFPLAGGVLATSGGVVFYGTLDGWLRAADAKDGRVLWQYHIDDGITAQPVTYQGPEAPQYIAVIAGIGGPFGQLAEPETDVRDATAAHGLANALSDLPRHGQAGSTLYIFRLP